jgi:hypothetical protein
VRFRATKPKAEMDGALYLYLTLAVALFTL